MNCCYTVYKNIKKKTVNKNFKYLTSSSQEKGGHVK